MMAFERILESIFSRADLRLHKDFKPSAGAASDRRPWDICVKDSRFFRKVFFGGSIGFGEAYMDGWWCCADIEELSTRLYRSQIEQASGIAAGALALGAAALLTNRQTRRESMDVAERHYNLDAGLFGFLGKHMNYSCGYFKGTDDLDRAQEQKLELICRKLELSRGDRVADIGGGWGEFARHAVCRYGCHVTSINIADEQIAYARESCKDLPVDVVKCDYRDLQGTYDKIAAIAMVAHVGYKNYRTFMEAMHRRLSPNGILLIETVGSNTSVTHCDPWVDKYIFPRGVTPSLRQLSRAMEGLFVIEDLHNFAPHYVKTLRAWRQNLAAIWPGLAGKYDERTRRMFDYLFQMSVGAFRSRSMQYWHLVMTKTGAPQPAFARAE
jgi:cyclopropane-fatty-acyl-phospholipid synthase